MNNDDIDLNTNAAVIASLAREASKQPALLTVGEKQVLLNPSGAITSLEKFQPLPYRKRAAASTYEAASFIDYVNRHKIAGSTHLSGIATEMGGSFSAIIDYHTEGGFGAAAWGDHTISLSLHASPEWQRWVQNDKTYMSQEQFAEFIEDNLTDIIHPDAASILEMAQGLQGKKTVQFKSGKNLKDGVIKLEYVETIEVNGSATRRDDTFQVPNSFTLALVPFIGANGVDIEARLRFRIGNNGALMFAYILNRPYKVIEQAFDLARTAIEENTGIKVVLGQVSVASPK